LTSADGPAGYIISDLSVAGFSIGHGLLAADDRRERPGAAGTVLGAGAGLPAGAAVRAADDLARALPRPAGEQAAFDDRLFDPAGLRPPIWFQQVPETKTGKNRLHLDLYPTGRDNTLPLQRRIEIVEAKVAELVGLGASMERRTRHDDP
jgi:glyoxalase superfamily protein